jgi:hypothetical protein
VLTLACPQLTPELAFPLSRARAPVFVDAAVDTRGSSLRRLDPSPLLQALAHAADPRVLLALARDAFGRAPMAWMLTVPAEDLGFGEDLSPMAERGVMEGRRRPCAGHSTPSCATGSRVSRREAPSSRDWCGRRSTSARRSPRACRAPGTVMRSPFRAYHSRSGRLLSS